MINFKKQINEVTQLWIKFLYIKTQMKYNHHWKDREKRNVKTDITDMKMFDFLKSIIC